MDGFDANVGLGRFAAGAAPFFATAGDLLAAMDRLGIGEALVTSVLAKECGPEMGNSWLVRETAGQPRLHACLTLVPADASLAPTLDVMRTKGLSCGRVFPRAGHFSVHPWCLGPVAEGLLALPRGVLFVDYELTGWSDDGIDWAAIRALCLAYPALPVVAVGVSTPAPRLYDRLMDECPNLHLEISRLHVPGELARLCAKGCGRRLLFGSDAPRQFPGGVLSNVRHARLADPARADILAGNLRRLLAAPAAPAAPALAPPAIAPAIDMHVHYGRWHHSVCGPGDADGMVAEMDRCGIAKAVLTSIDACYGDVRAGNEAVADACRRHPGRLLGYITLDPKIPAEMADELARHGADPAFRGLKFHCGAHGVSLGDAGYAPALEFAGRRGWPVLVHGGGPDGADVWLKTCERHPGARLLVAHAGGMLLEHEEERRLVNACRDHANLFLDLGVSRMAPGMVERLADMAGVDRLVYGSDYPLFDFGYERGRIDYAELSPADKARILSGNAGRLLGL